MKEKVFDIEFTIVSPAKRKAIIKAITVNNRVVYEVWNQDMHWLDIYQGVDSNGNVIWNATDQYKEGLFSDELLAGLGRGIIKHMTTNNEC